MTKQDIIDKIIEEVSDWNIVKSIINRYNQEDSAVKQRAKQLEEEREKAKQRRFERPIYYQESARDRGLRMRKHNETVASQGYGSSYF